MGVYDPLDDSNHEWVDVPDGTTAPSDAIALSAATMAHIDSGIEAVDTALATLGTSVTALGTSKAAVTDVLMVVVYTSGAYPARPSIPAGHVRWIGPVQPSGWLTGDEWMDNS